jgi:hypothetical protein
MKERYGHVKLPVLEDENTNKVICGGEEIVEYLYGSYCLDEELIASKQTPNADRAAA